MSMMTASKNWQEIANRCAIAADLGQRAFQIGYSHKDFLSAVREPSAALAIASLLYGGFEASQFEGKPTALLLTGENIGLDLHQSIVDAYRWRDGLEI